MDVSFLFWTDANLFQADVGVQFQADTHFRQLHVILRFQPDGNSVRNISALALKRTLISISWNSSSVLFGCALADSQNIGSRREKEIGLRLSNVQKCESMSPIEIGFRLPQRWELASCIFPPVRGPLRGRLKRFSPTISFSLTDDFMVFDTTAVYWYS